MLRLPRVRYLQPKTAREAAAMAAEHGARAMFVAGGTDLLPKLKRRQFEVDTLIGLDFLPRSVRNGSVDCVMEGVGAWPCGGGFSRLPLRKRRSTGLRTPPGPRLRTCV